MDSGDAVLQTTSWTKTREAVANFRKLLLCSKCSNLMKEPVCLGMCEHLLCRSCAGPKAGAGCVVCHSPAFVKDIQINRQLSSIIELFCGLDRLINPIEQEDLTKQESPAASNQKKNFKIWFSPRSRKIRCLVEKSSEASTPVQNKTLNEPIPSKLDISDTQSKDLSVFNFTSSSQDSGLGSPQASTKNKKQTKKNARKKAPVSIRAPQMRTMQKRKRLEAINQQWGITEGLEARNDHSCVEEKTHRSGKRVSFGSPAVTSFKPQTQMPQGIVNELNSGSRSEKGAILNDQAAVEASAKISDGQNSMPKINECNTKDNADRQDSVASPSPAMKRSKLEDSADMTPKRPRVSTSGMRKSASCNGGVTSIRISPSLSSSINEKTTSSPKTVEMGDSSDITPKRPNISPSRKKKLSGCSGGPTSSVLSSPSLSSSINAKTTKSPKNVGMGDSADTTPKRPKISPSRRRKSASRGGLTSSILSSTSLTSPVIAKTTRSPRVVVELGDSPSTRASVSRKSPRLSSGSPAVMKRNHKGETPLHIAAIKGDAEAVRELLEQGADPNLKDNAGWTPLHEACNLGHLRVVERLVSKGALLNTPGYENDSPLHDAVRNGHIAIARLLLKLGASTNVLNLHGKRAVDYAASREMQEVFQEATEGTQNAKTTMSPTMVSSSVGRGDSEELVILSSKLSQTEQQHLAKVGQLLEARLSHSFSESVSHVVVPDGPMPTTFSTLLGVLAGCWVVKHSWVEACLQAGERTPEIQHEAGEGPQRSRINRCSLLPPLFDGCFFFLLGSFSSPSKEELSRLLREGGGQILSRQPKPDSDVTQTLSAAAYHAPPGSDQALCTQYILFDPHGPHQPAVIRRGKVWSAPSSWVIECIKAYRLLPVPDPQTPK